MADPRERLHNDSDSLQRSKTEHYNRFSNVLLYERIVLSARNLTMALNLPPLDKSFL